MTKAEKKWNHALGEYRRLQETLHDGLRSGLYGCWPAAARGLVLLRLRQLRCDLWQLKRAMLRGLSRGALVACLVVGAGASLQGEAYPTARAAGGTLEFEVQPNPFLNSGWGMDDESPLAYADLDADGDIDAVMATDSSAPGLPVAPVYFANTGTPQHPQFERQDAANNPFSAILLTGDNNPALADIDGDGDYDFVVSSGWLELPRLYENTGSPTAPQFTERTGPDNPFTGMFFYDAALSFADLDGDSDLDLAVSQIYGAPVYYENTGTAAGPQYTLRSGDQSPLAGIPAVGAITQPVFADMDADGDFDLAFAIRWNQDPETSPPIGIPEVHYYENTGSAAVPVFTKKEGTENLFYWLNLHNGGSLGVVDIDSDGDLDVFAPRSNSLFSLGYGLAGEIQYYQNTGTPQKPEFMWMDLFFGEPAAPYFADIDGDQDFDLFFHMAGKEYQRYFFKNTGSSQNPVFEMQAEPANPLKDIPAEILITAFVDLDGDGDLDLLGRNDVGEIVYFENTGAPSTPAFTLRSGSDSPLPVLNNIFSLTAGDLDADDDYDLLLRYEGSANSHYFENTGSRTAAEFVERTGTGNPVGELLAGNFFDSFVDVDLDGDFDLVAASYYDISGTGLIYLENTGTPEEPTFEMPYDAAHPDGHPLYGLQSALLSIAGSADIDGDGDFDMLVSGTEGALILDKNLLNPDPHQVALTGEMAENEPAGTVFGELSPSLPLAPLGAWRYTLVSGEGSTDNARFEIDGSRLKIKAPLDFEEQGSYAIRMRAFYPGGLTYESSLTLAIQDLPDTPPGPVYLPLLFSR